MLKTFMCVGVLLSWGSVASFATANELQTRVEQYLKNTKTLEAEFSQIVHVSEQGEPEIETGMLYLHRPEQMRWVVKQPFERVVLADGEILWEYDASLEQAIKRTQADVMTQNPVIFMNQNEDLNEQFNVSGQFSQDGVDWLTLTPKQSQASFTEMRIGMKDDQLVGLAWTGQYAEQVLVRFNAQRVNGRLPRQAFRMDLPDQVEVIDETQATELTF